MINSENSVQLMSKRETNWFRGMAAVMVVLSHYAEWWTWFTPAEANGNMEIFRLALTKLGVYGVDLFFLFSGYAMVKSLGQERMYPKFVWKRIKNVYIPYFLVAGAIELLSGGFVSLQDFLSFATGYDYWYMFVLFIFYIGFILIYALIGGRAPRVIAFSVFAYVFSHVLCDRGMQDFWYVSNITFAIGVIAGEYEAVMKKVIDKIWIPLLAVLGTGMIFAVRSGLYGTLENGTKTPEQIAWYQIGATVVWTLLILTLTAKCRMKGKIFGFLGSNSLYIYLTHTFLFMWCVNNLEWSVPARFAAGAAATVIISFLLNCIITGAGTLRRRFLKEGKEGIKV